MKAYVIALLLAIFMVGPMSQRPVYAEQSCNEQIPASAPAEHFQIEPDGTLYSTTTGLVWMRCSLGQTWDGDSCRGDAEQFSWSEALRAAAEHSYANADDWRLPSKNELDSLVEMRCSTPAIDVTMFPATPAVFFWTASPYAGVADGAWSIDFAYGTVIASVRHARMHVRLVRDDQQQQVVSSPASSR